MTDKLLLTVPEAAELLSVSRTETYQLIQSGRLRSVRLGNRTRIPRAAVVELVMELEREAVTRENKIRRLLMRGRRTA